MAKKKKKKSLVFESLNPSKNPYIVEFYFAFDFSRYISCRCSDRMVRYKQWADDLNSSIDSLSCWYSV